MGGFSERMGQIEWNGGSRGKGTNKQYQEYEDNLRSMENDDRRSKGHRNYENDACSRYRKDDRSSRTRKHSKDHNDHDKRNHSHHSTRVHHHENQRGHGWRKQQGEESDAGKDRNTEKNRDRSGDSDNCHYSSHGKHENIRRPLKDHNRREFRASDGITEDQKTRVDPAVDAHQLTAAESHSSRKWGKLLPKAGDHALPKTKVNCQNDFIYKSSEAASENSRSAENPSLTLADLEYSTNYDSRIHGMLKISSGYAPLKQDHHEENNIETKEISKGSLSFYSYTGGGKYLSLKDRYSRK